MLPDRTIMSLSTVPAQKKYGLITKTQNAVKRPKLSQIDDSFGLNEDDEDEVTTSAVSRVNMQLQKSASVALKKISEAVDDYNDYDSYLESQKSQEVASHPLSSGSKEIQKSRYVSNIKVTATLREKEKDRVYERKLLKEREVEDKLYGDQPKFMTSAYKKKLMEDKNWEYEDRLADKIEEQTDYRKSGMHGFYSNLLTKNIAMGGDIESNAISIYTAGSTRQQTHINDEDVLQYKTKEAAPQLQSQQAAVSDASQVAPVSTSNDTKSVDDSVQKEENINNNDNNIINDNIITQPKVLSKEEQIALARSRFLTRKRANDS